MAYALLLSFPLSLALRYIFDAPAGWGLLDQCRRHRRPPDWIRRTTEQLAGRAGSTIGGLLNVSFGNTAELVLALFALRQAQIRVVQAQITGSIIGTTLLFLGISVLVGGVGRTRQTFSGDTPMHEGTKSWGISRLTRTERQPSYCVGTSPSQHVEGVRAKR